MTHTRRGIITGILAAATLPATAIAAPVAVDPIFAAIEAHRGAFASWMQSNDAINTLEATLPKSVTRWPRVLVGRNGKKPIYAESHPAIDNFFKRHIGFTLAAINYDRETIRQIEPSELRRETIEAAGKKLELDLRIARTKAHAELDRVITRRNSIRASSGLEALEQENETLCNVQCILRSDMIDTNPTTPAGVAAILIYLLAEHDEGFFNFKDIDTNSFMKRLRNALALMV
jgi:hypothetical protein